ncbi:putative Ankyrin repeat-containing protein [Hibiscus syriacus]|uniref:Ankyrin repeat-containing protein n=1 Tax=Hibiscus syriacus TaxID=106335 RepID=A0A6A2X3F4_HIBSY|nr:putative Ankyrin repeat-containing protein [Hibiscus syriacus]
MDPNLKTAAESGNVSQLYELIERDGNILRRFDKVEFIETPLHIAAEKGCIGFAMEILNLKPSFSRKLNHRGLSPMHIAVEKRQQEMALRLLEVDKDVVRVRGKNGETPFHYLCKLEDQHRLLDRFMQASPECIGDVTVQNRTALHIAVESNRPDILKVLLRSLGKEEYYHEVINRQDEDGNTALHIAATKNQPQMVRLLLECKADKQITNLAGLSALDVSRGSNNRENITILGREFIPRVSNLKYKWRKRIVECARKSSSLIFHDMDNISGDDRNALLVILGLLLTATFQSALSPPGGVWQGDDSSSNNSTVYGEPKLPGTSMMNRYDFIYFYIPAYIVFIVTFFLTLDLLKPFPQGFRTALQVLLSFLAICFDQSISLIAPTSVKTECFDCVMWDIPFIC